MRLLSSILLILSLSLLIATASVCADDAAIVDDVVHIPSASDATISYVRDLTDATFEHDTQSGTGGTVGDFFVEFYAPWCGHCKSLAPVWIALSQHARSESIAVTIAALDCIANPDTCARFAVKGFPSLKYISRGRVYPYAGARSIDALKSYIESEGWLAESSVAASVPVPIVPTASSRVSDYLVRQWADIQALMAKKPKSAYAFSIVGCLFGIMATIIVFIVAMEPKNVIHRVVPPTLAAMTVPTSSSSSVSASTVPPPTSAASKKAE